MDNIELIDQYLDGDMPAAEKADFERRLAEDAAFAEEFAWQRAMREVVIEQASVQSIMRRLEMDGYFEKPAIVPPAELAPVSRKNYLPQIALPLLLIGVLGWFFREEIKKFLSPEEIGAFPLPPPPPSLLPPQANGTSPEAPPKEKTQAFNIEKEAIQRFKKTLEYRDNQMGEGNQLPSSGDAIGMGAYFLKNGNIIAAEKLFQPLMASSNDSLALWGTEGMGGVTFFRKQYRQAFQYFEKVAADTTYVDDDYKLILELQMFLCCVADWQHLEVEGYEIFDKIMEHKDYIDDACKLQAKLQRKGVWRNISGCQIQK